MKRYIPNCRQVFPAIFILIFSAKANLQNISVVNPDPNQLSFTSTDNFRFFNASIINPNDNSNVTGSTLLYSNWLKGVVNFKNGKQLRDVDLKFDVLRNELYFLRNNVANTFVEPVAEFFIMDSSDGISKETGFSSGYPAFGFHTDKTFYMVIASGPQVQLLKYLTKIKEQVYEYSGPIRAEFKTKEDLYIYDVKNNKLKLINSTVTSVEKALPAYIATIREWQQEKKSKHLTDEELIDLINQVNNKNNIASM